MVEDEVSRGDAAAIHKFLLNCCASSILEQVDSCVRMERRVLGPPAIKCYSCSRRLVSYLTTNVKLYTCEGVKRREKVALQCKECNLIYSLTQFGNKHTLGFQYYLECSNQLLKSLMQFILRGICWNGSAVWRKYIQTKADKDPVGLVYACLVDQRASADQVSPIVSRQGSLLIKSVIYRSIL